MMDKKIGCWSHTTNSSNVYKNLFKSRLIHNDKCLIKYKHKSSICALSFLPTSCSSLPSLLCGDCYGNVKVLKINSYCDNDKPEIQLYSSFNLPKSSNDIPTTINNFITTKSNFCIASDDSTLYYYDSLTLNLQQCFEGHVSYITDVKKNYSDDLIISSSLDKSVRIFHNTLKHSIFVLNVKYPVLSCCFVPYDNNLIITCNDKNKVELWDLRKHSTYVSVILEQGNYQDFQPAMMMPMDESSSSSGSEAESPSIFGGWNSFLTFNKKKKVKKNKFEAIATFEAEYKYNIQDVWNANSQSFVEPFTGHKPSSKIFYIQTTQQAPFSLLTSSTDYTHKLWSIEGQKGLCTYTYKNENSIESIIQCKPVLFDKLLLSGSLDGKVIGWEDLYNTKNSSKISNHSFELKQQHHSPIRSIALSENGDLLASSDPFGNISILSMDLSLMKEEKRKLNNSFKTCKKKR
ncbi:hypothetical protein ABK040_007870 [Willaertia magna]